MHVRPTPNTRLHAQTQVFIGSATKMQGGEPVSPSWISGNLLRCMVFNITAIVLLAVGLQASVGKRAAHARGVVFSDS